MPMPADRLRNLGFLIRDVSRLYGRHFERRARELELTLAQCKVLAHLSRNEGISQARLAELTETDPMTLVRTLDRMQEDHWLERRADPSDRRAHRLFLREEAKPVLARMWKIADQARGEAISALSSQECQQLLELLGRLHEQLQSLDARSGEARRTAQAQPALAADGRGK